jgi:uncharacterized protein (DUF1800 family)
MPDISAHTGVLGTRLAAHLLRRATFGPTKAQILDFATKTPQQAVAALTTFNAITNKPIDPLTNATWVDTMPVPVTGNDDVALRGYVTTWFLDNIRTDNTLRSKMLLFLHQNWIVNDESWASHDFYDHLKLLEFYCLGSYKTLAKKMCRDSRMLVYLNGFENDGSSPTGANENYAREFLELFTIGKGPQIAPGNYTNYTEIDIKEAAKLLSGYVYNNAGPPNYYYDLANTDPDTGIRRCKLATYRHSPTNKTFSSAFQNKTIIGANGTPLTETIMLRELDDFVTMVFDQDATAKNIARKLYRYFVCKNITSAVETDIITPLGTTLKNNNYNLSMVVSQLLQSRHFYDLDDAIATDNKVGGILKSPLELAMNTLRFFNLAPTGTPDNIWSVFYKDSILNGFLITSDMNLFNATTVAGYPAYYLAPKYDRHWFDSSNITQRYYLGKCLLENKRYPYYSYAPFGLQHDMVTWVKNNISNPADGNVVVDELVSYLLPESLDTSRRSYFLNQTLLGTLSLANWTSLWTTYIAAPTVPANLTNVKSRLDLLFKAIIFSQEYQLQ